MIDIHTIGIGADTSAIRTANKDLAGFDKSADKASRSADGLTSSVVSMAKGFIGVSAGVAALSKLAQTMDEYTKYTTIIKNATSGQNQFNSALSEVKRIANLAQTDLSSIGQTYARLSLSLKDFGATQAQVAKVTETVALALKANGATAGETASTMLQLSQAFGKGRINGDEFTSMSENAAPLMRALAASMGVTNGELKDLAANGALTAEKMLKAWSDPALIATYRAQAAEIKSVSGSFTELSNEISTMFGSTMKNAGLADFLTKIIGTLTTAVRELNQVLTQGKVSFDSWLPAYDKFRAAMDKQSQTQFKFATTVGQAIGEGGFEGLKTTNASISIMTDAEIEAAEKAQKEIARIREKANKEAAEKERQLRDAESAWRAKRDNDYQDELRKSWEKNEKEKAKMAEDLAKEKQKADQKRLDELSRQAERNYENAQREATKQAEAVQREYDRINDALGRSLTDALMRGFESGKSFAQNFIDTLKNMFGTLVLRPAIEWVLSGSGITGALAGLGGLFSGNASAGGGFMPAGTGTSQGVSLVKGIVNGFDGINNTFQSSIESLGAYLAESQFSSIKSLGGMIGQYSSQIASIAPYAGAALQLLSGDIKGAAFTGAGTAIGSYFGGPVGGAIGSFIGSAVGSLFGGSEPPMIGSQSKGTYTGGSYSGTYGQYGSKDIGAGKSLNSLNEAFTTSLGTLLGDFGLNDKVSANSIYRQRTNIKGFFGANFDGGKFYEFLGKGISFDKFADTVLGPKLVKAIQMSKLPESIKDLFDGITEKTQVQTMIAAVTSLNDANDVMVSRFGITAEVAAMVAKESGLAGDSLAQFAASLASSALATQKSSVTMIKERDALKELIGSMPTSVDAFDLMLKAINTTTAEGQAQFAELFQLRQRFATYTGSFDAVVSNVESALYGMLSPSEQLALDQANLAKAFGELNMSVPGSIQELINLGKSIDYTTESGLDLALAFPALVDMFGKTQDAVNALTADLSANYFSTLADFRSAQVSDSPQSYIKNQTQINADLLAEIQSMKQDSEQQKAVLLTVAEYTFKQSRVLDDWDANGMPAERTL